MLSADLNRKLLRQLFESTEIYLYLYTKNGKDIV